MNYTILSLLGFIWLVPMIPGTVIEVNNPSLSDGYVTTIALITSYSENDSCHYPIPAGCLTASGTIAKAGVTVACPRYIPLSTKINIGGHEHICEDRYNSNLSDRFDLFAGYGAKAHKEAKEFGAREMVVKIYHD